MERSAELTDDPKLRAGRALVAAEHKRLAGALDAALALAALAERGPLDDVQRAEVDVLRGRISFASERGNEAPRLLLKAAQRLELHDVGRARETYLDAIAAAVFAGRLAHEASARDVATAALAGRRPAGPPRASDLLLEGVALLIAEGPATGTGVTKRALDAFCGEDISVEERLRWSWLAASAAAFIWDYDSWDLLTARQVQAARDAGALAVLPLTLSTTAGARLFAGQLATAASLVEQVEALADATDAQTVRYAAIAVAAFEGHERDARRLIAAAARDFASRGEGVGVSLAGCVAASLCNGLARYDEAFAAAADALEDPGELWFSPWAYVELIEAASRTGRAAAAEPVLERLVVGTSASGTAWAGAIEARSRALLSEGSAAETLYRDALDRLAPTALRLDLARTHLVFGEWLRREHRPAAAREQLRAAHQLFTEFGADGFAERARIELRATGEHVRKRTPDTSNDLTPQETRIAQLVGEGATNAEIAAQLFISPSTVEYHLRKVFRKLDVKSRTQLARRMS
jgi:DNA-binding CsgD family transcriptional regulator